MQTLNLSQNKESSEENKQTITVHQAGVGKRVLAFVFDTVLVIATTVLTQSLITLPIAKAVFDVDQYTANYVTRLKESHLYVQDSNGVLYELTSMYESLNESEETSVKAFDYFDPAFTSFYTDFAATDDEGNTLIDISEYYTAISSNVLLFNTAGNIGEGTFTYSPVSEYNESDMYTFMSNFYTVAKTTLHEKDVTTMNSVLKYTLNEFITLGISTFIPLLIYFLILPLCLPNRNTLGQMLLRIGVASRGQGFRAKRTQVLIRFVVFFLAEIVFSVILFTIPTFLSLTFMIFSKEHTSFHDYLSATICVDLNKGKLYKDADDYLKSNAIEEDVDGTYSKHYKELHFVNPHEKEPKDED